MSEPGRATELVTSVTITQDGRMWINGQTFPFYLDTSGPVVLDSPRGDPVKVLALPLIFIDGECIVTDMRSES